MKLTEAQKRDLLKANEVYQKTVGTYDYLDGRADRMRTGKTLAKLGLVEWVNQYSANRYKRYRITEEGIKVAKILEED